jgi:hypothetical protein
VIIVQNALVVNHSISHRREFNSAEEAPGCIASDLPVNTSEKAPVNISPQDQLLLPGVHTDESGPRINTGYSTVMIER